LAKKRQIVLIKPDRDVEGSMSPLGSLNEVSATLGGLNTASDGSSRSAETGTMLMHGPGFVVEIATGVEVVSQAMVTLQDEETAWPVLMRLCTQANWAMMDLETGRTFGPGHAP
jgi:hypothetical protein